MRVRVLGFALLAACAAFGQSITATKAYVDRRYTEATNAVASIVTNETGFGFTEWRWRCDDPVLQAAFDDGRASFMMEYTPEIGGWTLDSRSYVDGYIFVGGYYPGGPDETVITCNCVIIDTALTEGEMIYISVTSTRERIMRNSLGLAMAKDLEKLPTHETVTNVARAVSNSFWDEENQVLWRMEFRGGEPMFVPVTNENVKATGGVE